ncbi:Uncharacterized protein TCM_014105 [Theobroma cacao]|uniref:Uncharacterized protein n=1 Tax=Theobroma cacao TaxID=3641 RepID=A0A061FYH2_THECC|nr:Uncharacterized protein TCM_014105 [Theobroma cacao]
MKEVFTKGYCPRKVSVVRDFPPYRERGVTPLNLERDVGKQQGENDEDMENPRVIEDYSDYDLSMCSDQGNDDFSEA